MDVLFIPTKDFVSAAKITLSNMKEYYDRYSVDWDVEQVIEKTKALDNYDLVVHNKTVGVMRLQFEDSYCYLRDLQVKGAYKNMGIGLLCLNEAKKLAATANLTQVKLRVFKISPAVNLYKRNGFTIESEDDRMFNMSCDL